jgi:two-component system nitrogen regulation sensor histidine kinase GlnL
LFFAKELIMEMPIKRISDPLQRILDNLHTAVLLFDEDLRLRYLNPAGEMMLASSARRTYGSTAMELFIDESLINSLKTVLTSGHPFTERERVLHLASDHRITIDLTVIPLSDPRHARELLVEMSQVDRQLRITREEGLLAQSQATRALVRGLAHEIKNPLGGLRGAAQLLERELSNEELKEYTHIIISEADRLQALMNRMLGPNALPQKKLINLHEVIERVRQLVQAELTEHVHLLRDYDPSIPEITADPDQLIQAILNLVRNAVQAVGDHGEITLRTRALRQYTIGQVLYKLVARIDVIDNGPGIPPEMKESIFLPMVTTRAEGTGLGLPIAQNLINMNGGLIECESQPGYTVFTVLLPLEVAKQHRNGNNRSEGVNK